MQYVIFTDLDGTLLDKDTYSYHAAQHALKIIRERKIPLVFCTSKTRAEIEVYRRKLKIDDPFISEDGGAIFIPEGYFKVNYRFSKSLAGFHLIELGSPYKRLTSYMESAKKHYHEESFFEMTPEEIAKDSGLTLEQAKLAKQREYDVVFKITDPKDESGLLNDIKSHNLNYIKGGRYFHLMGRNDKGKAVKRLTRIFQKVWPKLTTIGLGDSQNDFPMLNKVDVPILVQKKDKGYATNKYHHAEGVGPNGWNRAVLNIIG